MPQRSAIVRIKDVQLRVQENEIVKVPLLEEEVGSRIEFGEVLLLGGDEVRVGEPLVEGARVTAEVVEHGRANKVVVFKMKRRKNFKRTHGHRQPYTAVRITSIEG